MAVTYGFFDSRNGDRKYNADQMSEYFRGIVSGGVFQHLDGGLQVTAGTGLSVNVAAGRAIVQNRWIQNSASLPLSISAASETYGRKDAVVLRLDSSARTVSITVKTGTPAASPAAPSMTRSGGVYEMALAYVNVAAGATSVTVTDKRSDSAVCGWAAVAQAASGEVDQMLNDMKTGFDGETYDSPAAMVRGSDETIMANINAFKNSIAATSVSKNLIGSESGVYYSTFIPSGSQAHLSTKDGASTTKYNVLYFYDKTKTQITVMNISPGVISRNTGVFETDVYYVKWEVSPDVDFQLELGTATTTFAEYFPNAKTLENIIDTLETGIDSKFALKDKISEATTLCKNLIGMDVNTYYPLYIPAGTYVHLQSKSGTTAKYNQIHFYDKSFTLVSDINLSPGESSRTTGNFNTDIYYAKWEAQSDVDFQLEYGKTASTYEEYFPNVKLIKQETDELFGVIPAYYNTSDYFADKMGTITENVMNAGKGGDSFVFVSDPHWPSNAKVSPKLIKKIIDQCPISKIVLNGDYENSTSNKMAACKIIRECITSFKYARTETFVNVGNHEFNDPAGNKPNQRLSDAQVFGLVLSPQNDIILPSGEYNTSANLAFYVDNTAIKRRYFFIPSNYSSNIESSVNLWLGTELGNLPEGYDVVIISHVALVTESNTTSVLLTFEPIENLIEAYNTRGTYTYNGVIFDYSSASGKVVCVISGHTHYDASYVTESGIPIICTTTDAYDQELGGDTRTAGTVNEQAFDVVTIDTSAGKIYLTRIGYGSNREFTIPTIE